MLNEYSITQSINVIAEKIFNGNNSSFAKSMETSEANIRNYRAGTEPKASFIKKLQEKLDISFEWLFTGKGEMFLNIQNSSLVEPREEEEKSDGAIDNLSLRQLRSDMKLMKLRLDDIEEKLQHLNLPVGKNQDGEVVSNKGNTSVEAHQAKHPKPHKTVRNK